MRLLSAIKHWSFETNDDIIFVPLWTFSCFSSLSYFYSNTPFFFLSLFFSSILPISIVFRTFFLLNLTMTARLLMFCFCFALCWTGWETVNQHWSWNLLLPKLMYSWGSECEMDTFSMYGSLKRIESFLYLRFMFKYFWLSGHKSTISSHHKLET